MVQLMPLHPKTPSSLVSYKCRLVLPFWFQLTQAVLEKRSLNMCSSSSDAMTMTLLKFQITYQCMQTTNKNDAKNDKLMQNTNHSKMSCKNVTKINKILTEKKQHTQSVILTAKSS